MRSDYGFNGTRQVPPPVNDPVRSYEPGSAEKVALKARLQTMAAERIDIPLIIGGKDVTTDDVAQAVMPHDHGQVLADWHRASGKHVLQAVEAAAEARHDWARWPWRIGRRSSSKRRSSWPRPGATPSTPRRCSASRRPSSSPRSTPRAS